MTQTSGPHVLDTSAGLAGAYAALLLQQAGADVARAEPDGGDPLRRWRHGDVEAPGDGALFEYLRQGQLSVRLEPRGAGEAFLDGTGTDVVLASPTGDEGDVLRAACRRDPALIVVAITAYGLDGPYRDRPATDFTLQADSGALAIRGPADRAPYQLGGRTSEWLSGAYAAAAALVCWEGRRRGGPGALIDLSRCEVANTGAGNFMDIFHAVQSGVGASPVGPPRVLETPSIERTADGWVGFNTNAPHQIEAFLRMIGRPDLADSGEFTMAQSRIARVTEWNALVTAWTSARTTDEIVALAVAHKVPVAPVCNGRTVAELDHVIERRNLVDAPSGRFRMPARPWRIHCRTGHEDARPQPAPEVPTDAVQRPRWRTTGERPPLHESDAPPAGRPLEGLRVLDLTSWWAGPAATGMLAAFGADVIHVEAPARMDGVRMVGASFFDRPEWWELSSFFLAVNVNKRDLAVDLQSDRGHELMRELIAQADVVVENATPRVLDKLGLGWDAIYETNPRTILVRLPAFGLDGPWRERPGFAQNIEQASGLAWLTGERDDQPRIQRGPSDPNGGAHAVIALLVALGQRDASGEGCLVEAAMFDAALALAAEPIIEWSAYGNLLARDGNRSAGAAPQGLYACAGEDRWLAVSIETDAQWQALVAAIDRPDLAEDPALATNAGRSAAQDDLDAVLATWAAGRDLEAAVEHLAAAGVPAAPARDARAAAGHPQFRSRSYHELVDHPVAGPLPIPTLPFRLDGVDRWIRSPAPRFGQHNDEILTDVLGLAAPERDRLRADGVIADRPLGY